MDDMTAMGFRLVGTLAWRDGELYSDVGDDAAKLERCIYIIIIGGEVVRVGSSKGRLRGRIRSYRRYIAQSLERSGIGAQTPLWEAEAWRDRLIAAGGQGQVWARRGPWLRRRWGISMCTYRKNRN